jgi:hypothetical protein
LDEFNQLFHLKMIPNNKKAGRPCKRADVCDERIIAPRKEEIFTPEQPFMSRIPHLKTDYSEYIYVSEYDHHGTISGDTKRVSNCYYDSCIVQSAPVPDDNNSHPDSNTRQENIEFSAAETTNILDLPSTIEDYHIDQSTIAPLANFLSRPVLIKSFSWVENTEFNHSFSPWYLYFNNTTIKSKLDHYFLLRCKLKLKFVINASPFYYSSIMVYYTPLNNSSSGDYFNPCPVADTVTTKQISLCAYSQRPRTFIYPQSSEGAEMTLPFFYHKNWLNASSMDDLKNMGSIGMRDLFIPLLNANSVSGGVVDIQVYAWTEDLELAGPTVAFSVQSRPVKDVKSTKDEYGKGPISGPASAVADLSSSLANIPIIGPFATATSMIASGIGNMASLFGYTNVPVISDVQPFKNQPFPHLSTTQIGVPCEKLTLDPKNELSIDPKITGVDLGDELNINHICSREAYMDTVFWDSSQVTDDLIWNARVEPGYILATTGTQDIVQGTPAWMVSRLFAYWRGDIIFRLKFLCTKYHRGRVRISWDPYGDIAGTSDSTTQVYNKIVDITSETDVEFRVPYTQETSYLRVPATNVAQSFAATALTNVYRTSNGVLTIRVLNAQTSPIASAPIGVAVFTRCADNMEFSRPQVLPSYYYPYEVQSQPMLDRNTDDCLAYDDPTLYDMGMRSSRANEKLNLVHMGEKVHSLREIMRRQSYHSTMFHTDSAVSIFTIWTSNRPRLPPYPGYDPNGYETAQEVIGVGTSPYNFCEFVPLNWVNQCFIANRGSVMYNFNIYKRNNQPVNSITVTRSALALGSSVFNTANTSSSITSSNISFRSARDKPSTFLGSSLTNQITQSGLNVSVPMYSTYKFLSNNVERRNLGNNALDSTTDSFSLTNTYITTSDAAEVDNNSFICDTYVGIGTDFSPIFFLNVPTLYYLATAPTP